MKHIKTRENTLIVLELETYNLDVIRRGVKLATLINGLCYIIFYAKKIDEFNLNLSYALIEAKKASELLKADEFIFKFYKYDKEFIGDLKKHIESLEITQLVLARDIESRLNEIFYGSYSNFLLKKIPNTDLHFVSSSSNSELKISWGYDSGISGILYKNNDNQNILSFSRVDKNTIPGIFFKCKSTDFNNGIFIHFKSEELIYYDVTDNLATKSQFQLQDYLL
ncbi:hypothetical protein [Bacillus mesophilum]|uniref:Uncharacterized protein n=1 Tax=Bacillus mesophilum TaxID=1071718 RepID=A0A7V7RPH3_9BACI|nr:hypothetical protein [Bacillus mesophilum]KAB2335134.1 hypothetical protein F7732_00760 [Bacillus mesophilum]